MKKGGFPGGMGMPGNMNNLMKQAQRMQRQMEEKQKEMESKEFTGSAGGGAVTITMDGKKLLTKVHIDPETMDPEDTATLEELIMLAVNDASSQVDSANAEAYGMMGGGFGF
ncbi:MAG: YbaB/EbfC family nucleoid-associated protein [Eubacteriales bacterium]|nr:YbaB/EbfC family nucleoid-associated protein [Eubacteriales bacterium]